jgi:hypothetical protein
MTDPRLAEQLNQLTEAELLEALNATLAARRTVTPEQQAARDDDAFYESVFPSDRHPHLGPVPTRPDVD